MAAVHNLRAKPSLAGFLTLVVLAMVGIRLLFLGAPTGSDEAGFLLVGAGWDHGSSLYGDLWVDRPPLLIWIMELAGSVTALRLIGLTACVLMVLGVARAAYLAGGDQAARWAGATAAVFSAAPWLGVPLTNGEMLATPFVAWGFALATHALVRPERRAWLHALGAGVLAACAGLIKQTIVDVIVFAVVLAVVSAWQHRTSWRHALTVVGSGLLGVLLALGIGFAAAAARGTTVPELFDALVTFRVDAGRVIATSASSATSDRLLTLLLTWGGSGLALITALTVWQAARRRDPVLIASLAVIVFVSGTALLGGSYWAHYLFQLVPACALATGLLVGHVTPRTRMLSATFVLAMTCGNLAVNVVAPPDAGAEAEAVGTWLRESGEPSDTAVVAYGQPNVLASADMTSPYPYLWSLPVRTLDPDLTTMSDVLAGPDRPTWFVDWLGIDSWGVDPTTLRDVLGRNYREVAEVCGRTIWLDRTQERALATPEECP